MQRASTAIQQNQNSMEAIEVKNTILDETVVPLPHMAPAAEPT